MIVFYWITILAIFRVVSSDTEDVKEKLRNDLNSIKQQLHGMKGDTKDFSKSLDEFSNGLDGYLKKEGKKEAYNDKLSKANAVVKGASLAIPKFKSGEPGKIISGVLDMTSMALATFGGPYGAAAAVVLNIVSSLIGLFMSTPESSPSLQQVMAEVLDEFQDTQNARKMDSFVLTLKKVHNGIVATRKFSKEIEGQDLTDEDITQLKTEYELFTTDTLLGDVRKGIADEIESGKVPDAERALATLNTYCKLTIIVELVLVEVINYIREEGPINNKMPTFYHSFMTTTREHDKDYFGFLHLPEMKQALVAVMYQKNPGKYPELQQYIKAIKVDPIPELGLKENYVILLSPKKWPQWYFFLSSIDNSLIYGKKFVLTQSRFKLVNARDGEKGREFMLMNMRHKDYMFTAKKHGNCKPATPSSEVSYVGGYTMADYAKLALSCQFLCSPGGECAGCFKNCFYTMNFFLEKNTLSVNYVWRFTKVKSPGSAKYYLISATQEQFGVEYSLYMRNSHNANAYLKYGNPGEAGMFKLTKNRRNL